MSETETAAVTPDKPASPPIKAILGQKIGMTQIFNALGEMVPVTVVQAGPCHVTQVMTPEKHGYSAVQVTFGDVRAKSVNKPDGGQFKKANVPAAKWVREFRVQKSEDFR